MLLTIGQFSRMSRLSVKALRLYADTGLLPPAHVDPVTGYRYYVSSQAKRAEVIRILRAVDMPLDEIRGVLESTAPEASHEQLLTHRKRLAERLVTQQRMLTYLETIIQNKERIMPYTIRVIRTEQQILAGTRMTTRFNTIKTDVPIGFGRLMQGIGKYQCVPSGPPMLIYHDVIDEEDNVGDIEICIPVANAFNSEDDFLCRKLDPGDAATTVHHGPYEELASAYHCLFAWIFENGYELVGPPREIYLNDPREVSADTLQTKLEFPVVKKTGMQQ